ncbi:hypothetical protein CEP52_014234 [Fusarium oligoseptatum]|uniref:CHK kinase-like domain-containing protein n=1 Tax=Fusarium oligoseptatum TaxID=2604345 RepID=A0A428SP45_9HYPO|nr:hypothetical protein CEP52_014234 [Fusarium oligoseptatum]
MSSDITPLPTRPGQVTPEWLGGVLGQKVKSLEITRSIHDAAASKLFITIKYEDEESTVDRPHHICLKGGFNEAMMAIPQYREILITMYTREANFFNLAAPKLANIDLPKVWWAGCDTQQGLLVMEDLVRGGFTFGDPVDNWPVERVMTGVEQLAALHASTWGMTEADNPWLTNVYEETMINLTAMWDAQILAEGRPPFPDIIKGSQERTVAAMKKHFATKNPKFISLLHGDPHTGNTFIGQDGRPRFLDWQTLHIGSCFHDFAYFVVGALSVEDRRAHEFKILDHYLKKLAELGHGPFSSKDDDVIKEYSKGTMAGMGWVLTPYAMQRKERVIAMCERYCAAIVDHKAIELIESL